MVRPWKKIAANGEMPKPSAAKIQQDAAWYATGAPNPKHHSACTLWAQDPEGGLDLCKQALDDLKATWDPSQHNGKTWEKARAGQQSRIRSELYKAAGEEAHKKYEALSNEPPPLP